MKKNNTLEIKPLKKSIQINISTNTSPSKFIFSNNVNKIASSYLSMGRKIQNTKNIKASKILQINTISGPNYFTLNSKETKQTNGSITNSIINKSKNNNFINISSINYHNNHQQTLYKKGINTIKNRDKKKLSTLSKSKMAKYLIINGYQNTKNDIKTNKNILKNNINANDNSNNKNEQKRKLLDSKNKNKKIPMKSKIRQYKLNNKINKPISSSFNDTYITKRYFKGNNQKDIYNQINLDFFNSINNEKNIWKNINNNISINSSNLYENKNNHNRNNTTSFKNKEIMNLIHKKTLPNENNERNIKKILNSIKQNHIDSDSNSIIHNDANNNKINLRKNFKYLEKIKKKSIKVSINDKILDSKENQSISKNNIKTHHNFYYSKYLTNSHHNNINNNIIKNSNTGITNKNNAIKNNLGKQKEIKKMNTFHFNNPNFETIVVGEKKKRNMLQFQRNIKIDLYDYENMKNNKHNYKTKLIGRKSDFSLSQINDKIVKILLRNNDEEKNDSNNNCRLINYKNKEFEGNNVKNDNLELRINTNLNRHNKASIRKRDDIQEDLQNDIIYNKHFKNFDNKKSYDNNSKLISSIINDAFFKNFGNNNNYNINDINKKESNLVSNNKKVSFMKNQIQNLSECNNPNINNITKIKKNKEKNDKKKAIKKNKMPISNINKNNQDYKSIKNAKKSSFNSNKLNTSEKKKKKLTHYTIINDLFEEDNLEELPNDYDENFNDLYSIKNKLKLTNVILNIEGLFSLEGSSYIKYKTKFDKIFDKLYNKKRNSFSNIIDKTKKKIEITSNTKTNYSSSKKKHYNNNIRQNIICNN